MTKRCPDFSSLCLFVSLSLFPLCRRFGVALPLSVSACCDLLRPALVRFYLLLSVLICPRLSLFVRIFPYLPLSALICHYLLLSASRLLGSAWVCLGLLGFALAFVFLFLFRNSCLLPVCFWPHLPPCLHLAPSAPICLYLPPSASICPAGAVSPDCFTCPCIEDKRPVLPIFWPVQKGAEGSRWKGWTA